MNSDNKIIAATIAFFTFFAMLAGEYYSPENIVEIISIIGILTIGTIGVSTIMIIKNLKEIR